MNKYIPVALIAMLMVTACGSEDAQTNVTADTRPSWEEFAATTVAEYYERNPETAVDAGLHEYDGQMEDYSKESLQAYGEWLTQVVAEASAYADLEGIEAFERDYLLTEMNGQLFWLRESDYPSKNPRYYTNFYVSVYVDREYAPLEERLRAYTQYISQVPARLATMRENLEPPLPAPFLEISHGVLSGFAGYLETTVPELFAAVEDEQLQRQFAAANADAAEAVKQAAAWILRWRS